MIKKTIAFILFVALFAACKKDASVGPIQGSMDDVSFNKYETFFLDELWKQFPDWGTSVGYHKYDSILLIPDKKTREKQLHFVKVQLDSLGRYQPAAFLQTNKMDYAMMQNQLQYMQWQMEQLKAYEWDPSSYNVIGTFAYILSEHYAPLDKRLTNFYQKMLNVPAYYKEAEKDIKNPVVELTNLAIEQHQGGLSVFGADFADSLKKTRLPEATQKQMLDRAKLCTDAINGYTEFLKNLKNDHPRSFRLGKDLYDDKFKYEIQASETAQQIYNAAIERKKFIHHEMGKIALKLWPKYFGNQPAPTDTLDMIAKMIDTLSVKHARPDEFQATITQLLPKLTTFVAQKGLLTMDPTKPLVVRKEPGYMSGVAGASMSSPGPYDNTQNSYFNVGSLAGWAPEKAESYLREYNQYTLQMLCIHEAIPGHYVQLVYSNKAPSMIKSVFGNGAMVEGWAVYSEQMMLDNGYGNGDPEMWLIWYKWHLRAVCNTILDYGVHCQNMPKQTAMALLTHEAFQQQAEAEGKWKRVCVTSVQLDSYFTGYKEIMDLRDDWKSKIGDKYTLKEFNEKFLSYGSAPVKLIKEAMLAKENPQGQNPDAGKH
ncbi:DUF885 domain-containing protein [Mucilaginibacter sp. BT774]|uniref:DUF885 domain-containing protein n=1 Tax=Mucilaginibacter sp. BT774 TaxID=3062276 RepID=UPI0026746FA7|nr:DUF885 domain-containing protein [Mucilaginibacter sp. BT774]MDO3624940.1 DUF885 domain-containing protein [Mucilaginibacter sp. BT774]